MATQKAVFPRDAGLQARVLLTLFLLGLLYVALFVVIVQAGAGLATTVVILGLFSLAQLFFSDKLALASMGAKEVSPQQAPGLHSMIEKLCIQADLPKPKIAVADIDLPNAFAIGRSRKSATVCATTGIMRRLSPSELEGVMAHELAHVKHRDVLIMTIASFFASIAAIITQFGFFFGGGHGDDDNPSFAIVLLVSFVVYILSFFLMMALSRYREFAADRGAAIVTGRPSALSAALVKISSAVEQLPSRDLREAERLERMNAFFIVPVRVKSVVQALFSTHPPMEKRIERLQQLESQLQGTAA
jgi:heat shock protein HtpX